MSLNITWPRTKTWTSRSWPTGPPGMHMLRADTLPVQDRINHLKDMVLPGKIQFSACNNTKQGMEKTEGRAISVVPEATIVPSGVVRLMELQEQGWSYVRP